MPLRYRSAQSREQSGPDTRGQAAQQVKLWASSTLEADEDVVISVTASECAEAACGGSETVILLLRPGSPTQAARIRKPLEKITKDDVVKALRPLLQSAHPISTN